jgi:subtilase family serine protease
VEIALDVEWAHAVAPGATILLVEAASNSFGDLLTAVDTAVAMGAKQVSMSWGGGDFSGESAFDAHFQHPGVTFLASSGDTGGVVEFPAASPYVTSVGGTELRLDANSNRISETGWNGSGGGVSTFESLPTYQAGFLSAPGRGTPDVSYDASPATGFFIFDSSGGGSWSSVGGTSAGAPQWAGLIALANQGRATAGLASLGTGVAAGTNAVLYQLAGGTSYTNPNGNFVDITSGSNGHLATAGYDLVTGLGSPVANRSRTG